MFFLKNRFFFALLLQNYGVLTCALFATDSMYCLFCTNLKDNYFQGKNVEEQMNANNW